MRTSCSGSQRGFALIFAMFIVVLLLLTSLLLLTNSQYTAADTHNSEARTQSFDASEAGLNVGMDRFASPYTTPVSVGPTTGTMGSSSFKYWVYDNVNGSSSLAVGSDPVNGNAVQPVPRGYALIFAQGTGPNGIRAAEVEALIAPIPNLINFPGCAMCAGLDITGNWNAPHTCICGNTAFEIHANRNITASVGQLQGNATASGGTNTLPGYATGTPQVPLPTTQLASFVTIQKAYATTPPNVYIPGGSVIASATYTCPAGASSGGQLGCIFFYDGSFQTTQWVATFNGPWTMVFNGDFSATGNSNITFQQGQKSVIVVNGVANLGGNGSGHVALWSKGDATLNGNGALVGQIIAGGNINLLGGGSSGGFVFDSTLTPNKRTTWGNVAIKSWAEY